MSRFSLLTVVVAAGALAGCAVAPTAPGGGAAFFSTPVEGANALFPVSARSARVAAINLSTGKPKGTRVCVREQDLRPLAPVTGPSVAASRTDYSQAPRDYGRAVNDAAFRVLLTRDPVMARAAVATLRQHADAAAWQPSGTVWSVSSAAIEGMGLVLPAWQILRQAETTSDADRAAIDGWLQQVARVADDRTAENNLGSSRAANDMLFGLMSGDGARYARGRAAFVAQLAGMRADGSFPLEVERGRGALSNQSRNIGFLVYGADVAASAGDDLWGETVDGKSIRTAIRFFLDAVADPALVDQYAQANVRPPESAAVFRPNDQLDPLGSATKAWAISFVERFPHDPLSAELQAKMTLGSRIQSDVTGGNSTCYASRI